MNVLDKLLDTVTENAFDNVLENVFENVLYNVFVFVVLCLSSVLLRTEASRVLLNNVVSRMYPLPLHPPPPCPPSSLSHSLSLSTSLSLSLSTSLSLSLSLSPSLYLYRFLCRARPLFELRRVIKMFRTARSKRILHILDVSNRAFDTFYTS